MKKVFLSIGMTMLLTIVATAQFHVELGFNSNMPKGDFADSYKLGLGVYMEPKYAMSDNMDLGLYIGSNGFAGEDIAGGGSVASTSIVPVLATGTYRFSTNKVTPYAGLGLGMYFAKGAEVTINSQTIKGESSSEFGFAPRAGVYLGRMNLGAAYNIVKDANYLQINLGVRILSRD